MNKFTGEWNARKHLKKENECERDSRVDKENKKNVKRELKERRRNQVEGKWKEERKWNTKEGRIE